MGRHSASRFTKGPRDISRLEPASESRETLREAERRLREMRVTPAEAARRRQRTKRYVFGALGVFVLVLLLGAVMAFAYYNRTNAQIQANSEKRNPGVKDHLSPTRQPGDPFYMLLLGEDTRPGETRARSDSLIIAYVNPAKKHVTLLSVPRDARVQIPGHGKNKINAAMQLGGASLTIDTVKELTGLPISHYMEINFNGFRALVDAIGGVYVDVPMRIDDLKAANHVHSARVIEKGYQKLDGDHALTFVRARHIEGDDFTRMKDQQIFIKALAKQTLTVDKITRLPKIIDTLFYKDLVTTDMSIPQLMGLLADFKGADDAVSAASMKGDAKYINGVSYVLLDEESLADQVRRLQEGDTLEETAAASPSVQTVAPSNVTVDVRNGAGLAGLAAQVSTLLKDDGFRVKAVGNMARPVYDHTLIVFKSNDAKARAVHDALGFGTVVHSSSLYQFDTDILVIVGKDWRTQASSGGSDATQ